MEPLRSTLTPHQQMRFWRLVSVANYTSLRTRRIAFVDYTRLRSIHGLLDTARAQLPARTADEEDFKAEVRLFVQGFFLVERSEGVASPYPSNRVFWDEAMSGPSLWLIEVDAMRWTTEGNKTHPHGWFIQQPYGRTYLPSCQVLMVDLLLWATRRIEERQFDHAAFETFENCKRIWKWVYHRPVEWEWPLGEEIPTQLFRGRLPLVHPEEEEHSLSHPSSAQHQLGRRIAQLHGIDQDGFARRAAQEAGGW
ncbi:hypothetical protein JCM8547_009207 [Rhodosporidiobolus lusitaniae]